MKYPFSNLGTFHALEKDLASIEEMVDFMPRVQRLDLQRKAESVAKTTKEIVQIYFEESHAVYANSDDDIRETTTTQFDGLYADADDEIATLQHALSGLRGAMNDLQTIYSSFMLPQAIVMLVSSLEAFLSTTFDICVEERLQKAGLHTSGAKKVIVEQYNFQNWGTSVKAYREILGIELAPATLDSGLIEQIQQIRHILVHRAGIVDERAVRHLRLEEAQLGRRLVVTGELVTKGIAGVRLVRDHLEQSLNINSDLQ